MIFKHRPKLGDIIYSLPFIKANGGGTLYLDPDSPHFPNQRELWIERFNWLMPLINAQDYIEEVKIWDGEPFDVDLDDYMNTTHLTKGDKVNIVDNHFIGQGQSPIKYEKWLSVKDRFSKITDAMEVVANSSNHQDLSVDYSMVISGNETFVGTTHEWKAFVNRGGKRLRSPLCKDALELADIIAKANVFIGNQSLPLAIALGLGKKCYVEESPLYPNCIMGDYTKL
jgi:hypothetical protein